MTLKAACADTPEQRRADMIASGIKPEPRNGQPSLDMRTMQFNGFHCMCLTFTYEGQEYETCCECWYVKGEVYSVRAKKRRKR